MNISILGGLFAVLFLRLIGPGTAGMGMRRRFLAVSLSLFAVQLGRRHGLKILPWM